MLAEPGSASSASSRARIGSSDASAAAGSSMTVTPCMGAPSHRQIFLSSQFLLSVRARAVDARRRDAPPRARPPDDADGDPAGRQAAQVHADAAAAHATEEGALAGV